MSQLAKYLHYQEREVLLKYHMLLSGNQQHPANALSALQEVLEAQVAVIEFDVNYLADEDMALLHDATLQRETTGVGQVRALDSAAFRQRKHRDSEEALCTLRDITPWLVQVDFPLKVQVDFKEKMPLAQEDALLLLRLLEPLRANSNLTVVVGCLADWNLRTLRRLDEELKLGLDFAFHLDAAVDGLARLPSNVGAYGYLDDHPLARRRLQPVSAYLRDRIEALLSLVADIYEVYLRKEFVMQSLEDGFNPITFIQETMPDVPVDVWTIDHGKTYGAIPAETMLAKLLEAGAQQITTNTALQWAALYPERLYPERNEA